MTLLAWMMYAVVVTGVVAAAAWVLERSLLAIGRPVRLVWALALVAALGLPLLAVFGGAAETSSTPAAATVPSGPGAFPEGAASAPPPSLTQRVLAPGAVVGSALTRTMDQVVRSLPVARVPVAGLLSFWIGGAAVLLVILSVGATRVRQRARRWPRARILGREVRIAPETGPVVIGVTRPRIVLPAWALALAPERLRLILLHEGEHIAARDTLLATAATLAVASCFWNPGLWWILRRLGAAMEVDCDRRVLGHGVPRADYGALLIEVGSRNSKTPLPAAAMAEPSHLLERRLRHMKPSSVRHPILGLALAGATALLLVTVACETEAPTVRDQPAEELAPEVQGLEAMAEEMGRVAGVLGEVSRQIPDVTAEGISLPGGPDAPVFVVDGILVRAERLDIDPERIESIEIVKGEAARRQYGERGRNGVVLVTTVDAPPPPSGQRRPLLRQERESTP
jgi:beta-lactamase regulating signal transducer with metallopeptidase domain